LHCKFSWPPELSMRWRTGRLCAFRYKWLGRASFEFQTSFGLVDYGDRTAVTDSRSPPNEVRVLAMSLISHFCGLFILPGSVIALATLGPRAANAGVTIALSYDIVSTEAYPVQQTRVRHFRSGFHLSGQNVFSFRDTRGFGRAVQLGHAVETINAFGMEGRVAIHVVGGALEATSYAPNGARRVVRISTSGSNSCSASVRFYKPPGQSFWKGVGSPILVSDVHAENVNCMIEATTPD